MCHQKDPTFFARIHRKTPFLPTFTQCPLFLTNSLSPKDPDISLSLKEPSFSYLKVKQVAIFGKKKKKKNGFFEKFDKMLRICGQFGPKSPYYLMHFTERPPILCALSLKDPLFDALCHRKTPTFEVVGGTRTSLSYVSAPRVVVYRWAFAQI